MDQTIIDTGSAEAAGAAWRQWLASPPGRYALAWEQAQFDQAVSDVFGFHALQIGLPELDCLRNNRMPHRVHAVLPSESIPADPFDASTAAPALADDAVAQHDDGAARGPRRPWVRIEQIEEWPFDGQSLDLVVLPHGLEFAQDPHQVLREADRVLRPEGRLIVTGFNPVSLWGARQSMPRRLMRGFVPRDGHFLSVPRLRDWLKLLSFEIDRGRYGCYRPPCRTQLWLERTRFMEPAGDRWWPICGATYMLAAVKRVRGMRLIGPAWRRPRARKAAAAPAVVSGRTCSRASAATDSSRRQT